jgi:hypothetical protein
MSAFPDVVVTMEGLDANGTQVDGIRPDAWRHPVGAQDAGRSADATDYR